MTSILTQRSLWNAASDEQQQLALQQLLAKNPALAEQFTFLGLRQFSCGDIANTVAEFCHKQTQMIFHLLPGDLKYCPGLTKAQANYVAEHFGISEGEIEFNEIIMYQGYSIRISPFLISRYVVTERVWSQAGGAQLLAYFGDDCAADAIHRVQALATAEHLGLKVPSEMQWEYACKAGSTSVFFWGDEPNDAMAITEYNTDFSQGYRTFTEAEQKPANAFGLLGMIGNTSEWVADNTSSRGPFAPTQKPLVVPGSDMGVLRGGGAIYGWNYNRSTSRIRSSSFVDGGVGVRFAFEVQI
jgi:hypothetical protein